jgi:hypothetical protein
LKFWKFCYCSIFVCIWQILSNHGLTGFVSWFTIKLCN